MMKKSLITATIAAITVAPAILFAKAPRSSNMLRDAITPVTLLKSDGKITLSGESDGDEVIAKLILDTDDRITALSVTQDDEILRLPDDSWNTMAGAKTTWLEERGALTTLVIEGVDDAGDWRLALVFHSDQLRQRRLSTEGQKRDLFTFYSRDDEMRPSKPKRRVAHSRGFHNH